MDRAQENSVQTNSQPRINVLRERFLSLNVCAQKDVTREELENFGRQRLCGTELGWRLVEDGRDGVFNPVQCSLEPDRLHWVFSC
jgi:hypothetical protein